MTWCHEPDLDALIARVNKLAEQQAKDHRLAFEALQNVIALTNAVIPVMLACRDEAVLVRFRAELLRITEATDAMVQKINGEAH